MEDAAWFACESRGKLRNVLRSANRARICYAGWTFAYMAAMRIALKTRAPCESRRAVWADVRQRGYGMPVLLDALVAGEPEAIVAAVDTVWEQMRAREAPASGSAQK